MKVRHNQKKVNAKVYGHAYDCHKAKQQVEKAKANTK